MLRLAVPTVFPRLFWKENVAVHEPVVAPALTTHPSPDPGATVAMPDAPPQLSDSVKVPFLLSRVLTVTLSGPGFEDVKSTVQGSTSMTTVPWCRQLCAGDMRSIGFTCVAPVGVTADDPLQALMMDAAATAPAKLSRYRADVENLATELFLQESNLYKTVAGVVMRNDAGLAESYHGANFGCIIRPRPYHSA